MGLCRGAGRFEPAPRCTPCVSWQTSDDTSTSAWQLWPSSLKETRPTDHHKENGRPPSTALCSPRDPVIPVGSEILPRNHQSCLVSPSVWESPAPLRSLSLSAPLPSTRAGAAHGASSAGSHALSNRHAAVRGRAASPWTCPSTGRRRTRRSGTWCQARREGCWSAAAPSPSRRTTPSLTRTAAWRPSARR